MFPAFFGKELLLRIVNFTWRKFDFCEARFGVFPRAFPNLAFGALIRKQAFRPHLQRAAKHCAGADTQFHEVSFRFPPVALGGSRDRLQPQSPGLIGLPLERGLERRRGFFLPAAPLLLDAQLDRLRDQFGDELQRAARSISGANVEVSYRVDASRFESAEIAFHRPTGSFPRMTSPVCCFRSASTTGSGS